MGPIICNVLNSNYFPIVKQSGLETLVFFPLSKQTMWCLHWGNSQVLLDQWSSHKESFFFKKILVIFAALCVKKFSCSCDICSSLCEEIFHVLVIVAVLCVKKFSCSCDILQPFVWRDFHILVIFAAVCVKRFSCSCDICSSLCEEIFIFLWYLQLFVWRDFHLLIVFTVC